MKIVITGGCDFIGSNLSLYLKEQNPGYEIFALDNLKRRGSELNINRLIKKGIHFVHGDMRSREDLYSLPQCDLLIDVSAEPSVLAGINSSQGSLNNNNLLSTINALDWCIENEAKM